MVWPVLASLTALIWLYLFISLILSHSQTWTFMVMRGAGRQPVVLSCEEIIITTRNSSNQVTYFCQWLFMGQIDHIIYVSVINNWQYWLLSWGWMWVANSSAIFTFYLLAMQCSAGWGSYLFPHISKYNQAEFN